MAPINSRNELPKDAPSKMIKLSSVSKTFGATVALHETNLDVSAGKTTVLIGPSGCGKSTILRLIIGLLEPTSGTIEIDGDRVSPANIRLVFCPSCHMVPLYER